MRRKRRRKTDVARDLALGILGATYAADIQLKRVIDAHIARVFEATDDNLSLSAKLLGMHRRTLQRMVRRKRPAGRQARKK